MFTQNTDLTRKVLTDASSNFSIVLSLGGKKLMTEQGISYMTGSRHKALRKTLLPLFTQRSLQSYLPTQEKVIREHIIGWTREENAITMRRAARDLNIETSMLVFLGPRLSDQERKELSELYFKINEGFLVLPIDLPFTTFGKAVRARKELVKRMCAIVEGMRKRIVAGGEPESLVDIWLEHLYVKATSEDDLDNINEDDKAVLTAEKIELSDETMVLTVLSFIFASQDALTSSLVWSTVLLNENPDVLARVREEVCRIWPGNSPLSLESLRAMTYTQHVVKEVLRYRPPATMVPHEANQEFKLTTDYTVPKGTLILPSIWEAQREGFENPETFEPERFGPDRGEDVKCAKNFLAFGIGPHQCLGREYAKQHMMVFIATITKLCDWNRIKTPTSDQIIFGPTIFPEDGAVIKVVARA